MRPGALTQAARTAASRQQDTEVRAAAHVRPRRIAGGRVARPERATAATRSERATAATRSERVTAATRSERVTAATRSERVTAPRRSERATAPPRARHTAQAARPPRATAASATRPARRISGPLRGTGRGRAPNLSVRAVAAQVALPLRPFGWPRRAPKAPARTAGGLGARFRSFVVSLPDHPWLDRAVRGRVWIPLLGVLLAGIVAAQVEILKLGASMGSSLEQTSTLTAQNELLRASVASLSNDQRIEHLAAGMGMVTPPPGAVGFLTTTPGGNVAGALRNLHAPNPASFVTTAPANGAIVTGPGTSTLPPSQAPATLALPGGATTGTSATATGTSTSATGTATGTGTTVTGPQASTTDSQGGATGNEAPATGAQTTDSGSQTAGAVPQAPATESQTPAAAGSQTPQAPADTSPSGTQGSYTGAAGIQPPGAPEQGTGG